LAGTRCLEEDAGVRTESVARDRFPVEPALAQVGNRAMPASGSRCVHVEFHELTRICNGFRVNATAHHHALNSPLRHKRFVPTENDQNDSADDREKYRNCEVAIDDVHDAALLETPAAAINLTSASTCI